MVRGTRADLRSQSVPRGVDGVRGAGCGLGVAAPNPDDVRAALGGWPLAATLIGAVGGLIVVFAIVGLDKRKIDDPVGAISVHGVVGFFGVMVVPLTDGDATFVGQLVGAGVIFTWVFVTSLIVWGILKAVMGLRVSEEEEYSGTDISECGLEAYPEFTKSS